MRERERKRQHESFSCDDTTKRTMVRFLLSWLHAPLLWLLVLFHVPNFFPRRWLWFVVSRRRRGLIVDAHNSGDRLSNLNDKKRQTESSPKIHLSRHTHDSTARFSVHALKQAFFLRNPSQNANPPKCTVFSTYTQRNSIAESSRCPSSDIVGVPASDMATRTPAEVPVASEGIIGAN